MEQNKDPSKFSRWCSTYAYFNGNPLTNWIPGMGTKLSVNALQISPETFDETWGILDDVIMGGNSKSTGAIQSEDDFHFVRFSGYTSIKGGGFCGIRTRNIEPALNYAGSTGVSLKVRSAQNFIYKFNLRDNDKFNSIAWVADMEVQAEKEWQEITIPFSAFEP